MTTATTDTQRELIAAILESPDEDTPRLAFADCIEEQGDPDWAELIRCQIEMARNDEPHDGLADTCRTCELELKQDALLTASIRARLLPPCPDPVCKGRGRWEDDRTGPTSCGLCKETGICPGEIRRGFPVLSVPMAVWGAVELERACWACERSNMAACQNCKYRWQPTPFALAALALGATVEPSDREAGRHHKGGGQWLNDPHFGDDEERDGLPSVVFAELQGAVYEDEAMKVWGTMPAAVAALSAALVRLSKRGAR